jgi:hypothetical protein
MVIDHLRDLTDMVGEYGKPWEIMKCFCGSTKHSREWHIARVRAGQAKFRFNGGEFARSLRHKRALREKKYR